MRGYDTLSTHLRFRNNASAYCRNRERRGELNPNIPVLATYFNQSSSNPRTQGT